MDGKTERRSCKCILIVGMHRSGTSCMSGLLKLLGVYQGKSASEGVSEENPKGHFENDGLCAITSYLMGKMGINWNKVPEEIIKVDLPSGYIAAIHILLKNEFAGNHPLISMKDPCLSLVLDSFLEAMDNVYVIRMHRPKEEVYLSLDARGDKYNSELYEQYNARLDYIIEKHNPNHVDVEFENLLQDPISVLQEIERRFDLDLKIESKLDEITEFVDPKLKRH